MLATALLLAGSAEAFWGNPTRWRDSYIRVSARVLQAEAKETRRLQEEGGAPGSIQHAAARDAHSRRQMLAKTQMDQALRRRNLISVEYGPGALAARGAGSACLAAVHAREATAMACRSHHPHLPERRGQRRSHRLPAAFSSPTACWAAVPNPPPAGRFPPTHPPLLPLLPAHTPGRDVDITVAGGGTTTVTVDEKFDCPWASMLNPDGLCLPYQEYPFPFPDKIESMRGDLACPGADGLYPGHNEGSNYNLAETYGCAAPQPAWPSDPQDANANRLPLSPICKGYIDSCKYSKPETREYMGAFYTINYLLEALGLLTDPSPSGAYPHEVTKGDGSADGECTKADSAAQWMDCGIPCPVGDEARIEVENMKGFAYTIVAFMIACAVIGAGAMRVVGGSTDQFFVGGRDMPLFVVASTLASQSLDSNASLGNIDLGYYFHTWDGAVLPIGLGLSLFLNAIFFAYRLNEMRLLTLPDLFARRFGPLSECIFSVLSITSFNCLLGGNLVGCGRIVGYTFGIDVVTGIWITTLAVWLYTVAGGIVSIAYTDVAQAAIGWTGLVVGSIYVLVKYPNAPGVSPAYPLGDANQVTDQMFNADALAPLPNAIVLNWATVIVLGFGNLCALDFQARVFGARTPMIAVKGCIIGGIVSWTIGVLLAFTSGSIRALYGPSSPYAEFVADSCSNDISIIGCFGPGCNATVVSGVPTCGEWKPDPFASLKFFTCTKPDCHYFFDFDGSAGLGALQDGFFPMNAFIGGWVLIGIVCASLSTADGAILAMATVFSHNLLRKMPCEYFKKDKNLLVTTRLTTILWACIAAAIASSAPGTSGYLLIVAFDIMLAGCVVPLFAAVYWKNCNPVAACLAMVSGSLTRVILEFSLPKDGLLVLVGTYAKTFGPGAYFGIDLDTGAMLPDACPQRRLEDWTGVDSLVSPCVSLLALLIFQWVPVPDHYFFNRVPPPWEVEAANAEPAKESEQAKEPEQAKPLEADSQKV
jgi:Na+/proline symporter